MRPMQLALRAWPEHGCPRLIPEPGPRKLSPKVPESIYSNIPVAFGTHHQASCKPFTLYLLSKRHTSLVCSRESTWITSLTDIDVHVARIAALPHHVWYEANIVRIIAAERDARDKEDTDALIILALTLQVLLPITHESKFTFWFIHADRWATISNLSPTSFPHTRVYRILVLGLAYHSKGYHPSGEQHPSLLCLLLVVTWWRPPHTAPPCHLYPYHLFQSPETNSIDCWTWWYRLPHWLRPCVRLHSMANRTPTWYSHVGSRARITVAYRHPWSCLLRNKFIGNRT